MANCSKCKAEILFLRHHETGKPNPIDAEPNPAGNLVLDRPGNRYRMATGNEIEIAKRFNKNLYISHFVTCPDAKSFRKEKDGKADSGGGD